MTTSRTWGQRARSASASPAGTPDEVSAGVRSRGRGITARIVAPGAGRSGRRPWWSRTSVSERSATSRARARCAAERTTPRSGAGAAASRRRRAASRASDAAADAGSSRSRAPASSSAASIRASLAGSGAASSRSTPGPERRHDRVLHAGALGDRRHVERVGDGQAAEPEAVAQELRHHGPGQRRGQVRVAGDRLERDVGGHREVGACLDRGPERDQLHGVEPGTVVAQRRQPVVRVGERLAQSREVLDGGGRAGVAEATHGRGGERGDRGRVVAERPDTHGGVAGVGGEVADRRVRDVDAHRQQLGGGRVGDALGEVRVAGRAQRHRPGERGRPVAQRDQLAALLVRGDQQRSRVAAVGVRALGRVDQLPDLGRGRHVEVVEQGQPRRGGSRRRRSDAGASRSPSNATMSRARGSWVALGRSIGRGGLVTL